MLFAFKVHTALQHLNVDPSSLDSFSRRKGQQLGKANGFTAEETAVIIASDEENQGLYLINQMNLRGWISSGKVRVDVPIVGKAIDTLMNE